MSDNMFPPGLPTLGTIALDLSTCAVIGQEIARHLSSAMSYDTSAIDNGFLAPQAAADHLGVTRKRLYDLKSMRAIEPDGFDGRTPLFTRDTLDNYARSSAR